MKTELDKLKIKEARHSATSIHAEKRYHSIEFAMIKKATEYFMKYIPKGYQKISPLFGNDQLWDDNSIYSISGAVLAVLMNGTC